MIPPSLLHISSIESMIRLASITPEDGCFIEVGVYKGGAAWHLSKLAKEQGRKLHLFDTFTGIPEQGPEDDRHRIGDFGDTSLEAVKSAVPDADYYVGFFPDTMPSDWTEPVAFSHIDCDQYKSIKACIQRIWPLTVPGGIMLFDDFDATSGCRQATREAFGPQLHFTPQGKVYAIKV